jgi:hypothetical protein
VQFLAITTNVVSLNLANGEAYSIQHHVIKFVSDLRPVFLVEELIRTVNMELCATMVFVSVSQDSPNLIVVE